MLRDNNNSILNNSLIFSTGVISGLLISYYYHNNKNTENRYTKTHYNIIINRDDNELLESYYIDYDDKKIYFEKKLENVDVIFYTTNAQEPIYIEKNFTGKNFDLKF